MAEEDVISESVGDDNVSKLMGALFEPPKDKKVAIPIPLAQAKAPVQEQNDEGDGEEEQAPDDEDTALAKLIDAPDDGEEGSEAKAPIAIDDDDEIDVVVDEETHKVKFKDLKANYSGEKAIEKRLQQATKARQVADQQANALFETNNKALANLNKISEVLKAVASPDINWAELRAKDPLQYALERDKQRDAQEKQFAVKQEADRIAAEQVKIQTDAKERWMDSEALMLQKKMPELKDPDKAKALTGKLSEAADYYGYSQKELSEVIDHRAWLVLRDAARYRELLAKKVAISKKTEPVAPTKTLRTVAVQPATSVATKKREAAIVNRARQTGNPDDVAATLLIPQRKRG